LIDSEERIKQASDNSLRNTFNYIHQAEVKAYNNWRTSIYFASLYTVFYSNTTAGFDTEAERIILPVGEKKELLDHYH